MLTDYFYLQLRQSVRVIMPLDKIIEVISLTRSEVCPIPGVPPALLGVVNQRGKLLWVLDLSDLLKIPPSSTPLRVQDKLTLVVLSDRLDSSTTGQAERQIGCIVSALKGVIPLNSAEFKPAPAKLSASLKSFIPETTEIEQSPVAVINVDAVLAAIQTSVNLTSLVNHL